MRRWLSRDFPISNDRSPTVCRLQRHFQDYCSSTYPRKDVAKWAKTPPITPRDFIFIPVDHNGRPKGRDQKLVCSRCMHGKNLRIGVPSQARSRTAIDPERTVPSALPCEHNGSQPAVSFANVTSATAQAVQACHLGARCRNWRKCYCRAAQELSICNRRNVELGSGFIRFSTDFHRPMSVTRED